MGRVTASKLPEYSHLRDRIADSDFLDCYSVESNLSPRQASDIITDFPGWAQMLMTVRSVVTAPFGLINDGPESGDKVGIFPIEIDNSRELIAGFNDKHLNFRISVLSHEGRVFLATWVHPHNIGGKFYLKAIFPFHVLIAKNALSRVYRSGA